MNKVTAFISDLHLKSDRQDITQRFDAFLAWAKENAKAVYILGDLFHVWAGDDCADSFNLEIVNKLHQLSVHGIALYFIAGNRDFLLGDAYARSAGMTILQEPYRLFLGANSCLLAHGDRYCLNDKRHQWFRKMTRHRWFAPFFLKLPAVWRQWIVGGVRKKSQAYQMRYQVNSDVDSNMLITEMQNHHVQILIHGHTHQPGETVYQVDSHGCLSDSDLSSAEAKNMKKEGIKYIRYVLSDWDDIPKIMCYDDTRGFKFEQFCEV